jgi:hypothetical protein
MDTFKVKKGYVEGLQRLILEGAMFASEKRGRYVRNNDEREQLKINMKMHINGYPRIENHYSRERHGDFFISSLSVSRMFEEFCDRNPRIRNVKKKDYLFRRVFLETGMKIGEPKSDTCEDCDRIHMEMRTGRNDRIRNEAQTELTHHQSIAKLAYQSMKIDLERSKQDLSYVVISGDLQQVDLYFKVSLYAFYCF